MVALGLAYVVITLIVVVALISRSAWRDGKETAPVEDKELVA